MIKILLHFHTLKELFAIDSHSFLVLFCTVLFNIPETGFSLLIKRALCSFKGCLMSICLWRLCVNHNNVNMELPLNIFCIIWQMLSNFWTSVFSSHVSLLIAICYAKYPQQFHTLFYFLPADMLSLISFVLHFFEALSFTFLLLITCLAVKNDIIFPYTT